MSKILFTTVYPIKPYAVTMTTLWAESREEAQRLCRVRLLGEVLVPPGGGWVEVSGMEAFCDLQAPANRQATEPHVLPSTHIIGRRWAEAAHAGAWVGSVATRCGVIEAWDLLGDHGALHNLLHALLIPPDRDAITELGRSWHKIERATPGMCPE